MGYAPPMLDVKISGETVAPAKISEEMNPVSDRRPPDKVTPMPVHAMLILAMAAFVTLLTEIMPAGLLSSISAGLGVSQAVGGQFITAFAFGALAAALPSAAFTHRMRRKKLLLFGLIGFTLVNAANALVSDFPLALMIRFLAGCFGGLVWAMFAGYATRLAPPAQRGRAIALAGSGVTLAMVLGAPLSALLGQVIGWRGTFGALAMLSAVLTIWAIMILPDAPGSDQEGRFAIIPTLRLPGVAANLTLIFSFVAAHSLLYVYIEPLLGPSGLSQRVDVLLLLFGAGSVVGLFATGILIDHHLSRLTSLSIALFAVAAMVLALGLAHVSLVLPAIICWGLTTGGFAALTQSAMAQVSGRLIDVAQAMATTAWNLAVSTGGLLGGALLTHVSIGSLPWMALLLLLLGLAAFVRGLRPLIR